MTTAHSTDALFRALIATAVDGIIVIDVKGTSGRIWASPNQAGGVDFRFRLPLTHLE
jgi:hypothetical protein